MQKDAVIAITGAAGFIGSCLAGYLNGLGYANLILIDDFSHPEKTANFLEKSYLEKVDRSDFLDRMSHYAGRIQYFFHLGARTDTTEQDYRLLEKLNLIYSQQVWTFCVQENIPLVYASSAATYGSGEWGYKDDESLSDQLQPLNAYGISKNEFDRWVIRQERQPPFWAGLKFFNVYGPNEYHKGRMASVIFHAFNQIRETGHVCLFKSHRPDYQDGGQLRDFIYVKDVLKVCSWLMNHKPLSGLYNLGTGQARSFYDLAKAVFDSLQEPVDIQFIDTPLDIRDNYQYFTEADMRKLGSAGYGSAFYTLEGGVADYVRNYLNVQKYL
ncbi:MAG TPA: ADP-glyceromanno-heptose 6-epimerase [Edaphocola sp.]|nr:ADP-glyceromanno-heptose 6-epimerase [Edaphocola sp.]